MKNYNVTIEGHEELHCYNRRTGIITIEGQEGQEELQCYNSTT